MSYHSSYRKSPKLDNGIVALFIMLMVNMIAWPIILIGKFCSMLAGYASERRAEKTSESYNSDSYEW